MGMHLLVTWQYLDRNGVTVSGLSTEPSDILHRCRISAVTMEVIDNTRALKERLRIYGAVFNQKTEEVLRTVKCPTMTYFACDEVL